MGVHKDPLHVRSDLACVLCRAVLSGSQRFSRGTSEGVYKDWQLRVICFCNVGEDASLGLQIRTVVGVLHDPCFLQEPLNLRNANGDHCVLKFCHNEPNSCPWCDFENVMFFVHQCCWKMARQYHGHLSGDIMYNFARQTRPITTVRYLIDKEPQFVPEIVPAKLQPNTSLGGILRNIAYLLPAEIQQQILLYLQGTLTFAFLSSLQTISVIKLIGSSTSLEDKMLRSSRAAIIENNILSAEFITLFGRTYLRRLKLSEQGGKSSIRISIDKRKAVRGLKYVLGTYGICAIRFLYSDGSSSQWLGSPDSGDWHARIYGSDLSTLCVIQDDLRVLRLYFISDKQSQLTDRVLWHEDLNFSASSDYRIVDTGLARPPVLLHSGWRLAQYLSLGGGSDTLPSFTVYCDHRGTTGIQISDNPKRLIGSRRGVSITYPLSRGELIVSIHLRTCDTMESPINGPYLLIGTTHGRFAFFGPYLFAIHGICNWSTLVEIGSRAVTGIFFDVQTRSNKSFESIGASIDSAPLPAITPKVPPTILIPQDMSPFCSRFGISTFFSSAKLAHVRRLQMRRSGQRCTGLCIHHLDESIEFLGQWDPSDSSSITTIYDGEDGPLESISFSFAKPADWKFYIVDIYINKRNGGDDAQHFTAQELNKTPLDWSFTIHSDSIQLAHTTIARLDTSKQSHYKIKSLRTD